MVALHSARVCAAGGHLKHCREASIGALRSLLSAQPPLGGFLEALALVLQASSQGLKGFAYNSSHQWEAFSAHLLAGSAVPLEDSGNGLVATWVKPAVQYIPRSQTADGKAMKGYSSVGPGRE